jgi:predicted HicB family RNase H-like nuclease
MEKNNRSRQSDNKLTKQVRIDAGLHRLLKIKASTERTSIKALLEGCLAELLAVS